MSRSSSHCLHLLGAGGAFSRRYGTTCSMLTTADGERWLIDCGRQAPDQLHRAGISWHAIDGQIVTHVHGDHVYGMEDFAFSRYYLDGEPGLDGEPRPVGEAGRSPAAVASILRGGPRPSLMAHSAVINEIWEVLGPSLRYMDGAADKRCGRLEHYFQVERPCESAPPIENPWPSEETFERGSLRVTSRETFHIAGKPCFGLLFDLPPAGGAHGKVGASGNSCVWWSGDGLVDSEWLTAVAARATILFQDCSFAPTPNGVHAHIDDIAKLPPEVRAKMVIMHHDDDVEDYRERVELLGLRLALPGDTYDLQLGTRVESGLVAKASAV